jgi:hypothetical protein
MMFSYLNAVAQNPDFIPKLIFSTFAAFQILRDEAILIRN